MAFLQHILVTGEILSVVGDPATGGETAHTHGRQREDPSGSEPLRGALLLVSSGPVANSAFPSNVWHIYCAPPWHVHLQIESVANSAPGNKTSFSVASPKCSPLRPLAFLLLP